MNSLILDCSCGMNVYVVKNDNVFSFEDGTQNKHSDGILKIIDDLLIRADLKISDINNICICLGPGSFTGVRVAVSVAKGLAVGNKAKVFVCSNFDIFGKLKNDSILVLDGFSNFVYIRKCQNDKIEDSCVDVDELVKIIKTQRFDVYHTTEKTQMLLNRYEISSKFKEKNIVSVFEEIIKRNEFVSLNQVFPVYLRASQAEIEREKKINGKES